jgi:hypothetical protein
MHRCHDTTGATGEEAWLPDAIPGGGNGRDPLCRSCETEGFCAGQSMGAEKRRSADEMVLKSNIVTVIGPTPPGTGVMYDAFCETP